MQKKCTYCKVELPLESFSCHPTAKYGRKHICKKCDKVYSKERYDRVSAENGVRKNPNLSVFVLVSTARQGDSRIDGSIFWSRRKINGGYREWWVTLEQFNQLKIRSRITGRMQYHKSDKAKARNRTPEAKASKKRWKEKNRDYFASFCAERRAAIRGTRKNLTIQEKVQVRDVYKFRDILNAVHGLVMFEVDHIKPVSRGGEHTPKNLQVATKSFNRKKWASYTTPLVSA